MFSGQHIHHQPDHYVLFRRIGLSHQQRHGSQADIIDHLHPLLIDQQAVLIQKVHKEKSGAALVAINKRMILDHKIQQMGRL